MSMSAARFSFAPSVKSARGCELDTDREIREFQDTNYVQCQDCGRYERHDEILTSDRCDECVDNRNNRNVFIRYDEEIVPFTGRWTFHD